MPPEFTGRFMILCGLPKSGKSTYAEEMRGEGWTIVCPDTIRLALHGQQFEPKSEPLVWANAELMARSLLMGGHRVVIDATNTTKKSRARWLKLAGEFSVDLEAVVMDTPAEECHRRNKALLDNGGASLPSTVIDRMANQWEPVEEDRIKVVGSREA